MSIQRWSAQTQLIKILSMQEPGAGQATRAQLVDVSLLSTRTSLESASSSEEPLALGTARASAVAEAQGASSLPEASSHPAPIDARTARTRYGNPNRTGDRGVGGRNASRTYVPIGADPPAGGDGRAPDGLAHRSTVREWRKRSDS